MAEVEIELKDEELLDFDGSDYEFGSDGGVSLEDEVALEDLEAAADKNRIIPVESIEIQEGERKEDDRKASAAAPKSRESKVPRSSSTRATDLEDGELSDMVNSKKLLEHGGVKDLRPSSRKHSNETMRDIPDREAERNGDIRHDRKRRKDHDYEKHQYNSRDRKEPYDRRYDRSDRRHDRYAAAAFPDPRTRGRNSHAQNFRPNLSPGIMGPGRPLRHDMGYHVRPSTAGLEIFSPAQLQELLNQEHMLRSQQMLLQSRLGIRPPMYPFFGPNYMRPAGSELVPRVNFMGPRGAFPLPGAGILGVRASGHELPTPSSGSKPAARDSHRRSPPPRRSQDSYRRGERESDIRRDGHTAGGSRDLNGSLIHLGGPVQKSRVLIVSGLQENTPMSTVADAFEKQGKILDFRKNQRGNVFTVTFSTVQEALSAKRHLHRTILGGRQITVEYAV